MKVGYHTGGNEKDYINSFQQVIDDGGNSLQIFIGNPKSYNCKVLDKKIAEETKQFVIDNNLFVIVHSPYLINFCRLGCEQTKKSIDRLILDINNTVMIGGYGTILHMGKNVKEMKITDRQACLNFIENLETVLNSTTGIIILENMCGCGTSICCEMKEWAEFWTCLKQKFGEKIERIKWCVDTAHLFATGEYNISRKKEVKRFYNDFSRLIGWEHLACFHFQGSYVDFGGKNDRHADIREEYSGLIKTKGLKKLAKIAFKTDKPLIMEIPGVVLSPKQQITLIKSWIN